MEPLILNAFTDVKFVLHFGPCLLASSQTLLPPPNIFAFSHARTPVVQCVCHSAKNDTCAQAASTLHNFRKAPDKFNALILSI